jgi:hypothetical protein
MISGQEVRDARWRTVLFSGRLNAIKRANLDPSVLSLDFRGEKRNSLELL